MGLRFSELIKWEVAMTPTDPMVENPHTAVPPRFVGSASA